LESGFCPNLPAFRDYDTRDAIEMRGYLSRLRTSGLWILIAAVVLLGLLVYIGHYLVVGRPLQSLRAAMERVRAGQAAVIDVRIGRMDGRQAAR
jgi:hypothetical protein